MNTVDIIQSTSRSKHICIAPDVSDVSEARAIIRAHL